MAALQTLVVDDSASARTALTHLLEQNGAQVEQTESGIAALDYVKSKTPDVIFMDHTMPGMSGLEAVEALRNNPSTAHIPVIMYTSHCNDEYRAQALKCGALEVIPKPATLSNIHQALQTLNPAGTIAANLSRELETQITKLGHELKQELTHSLLASPENVTHLIHSITDSKIHQLNQDLRKQMTAKLDVLLQDIQDDQKALKQELYQYVEQRLAVNPIDSNPRPNTAKWQHTPPFHWHLLTLITLVVALIATWP